MDSHARNRNRDAVSQKFGADVAAFLDRCGFKINRCDFLNTSDLALFVALTPQHKERLGLTSDELLLFLLAQRSQFQWFHKEVRARVRADERLDRAAAVIVSNDPDILAKCAEARTDEETGYLTSLVAIPLAEARKRGGGFELLERAFHQQAFVVDHFDCRVPVVGDNLFGRRQLVSQLESEIRRGGHPIGLFGLRRVGKSSVLSQLLTQLRSSPAPKFAVAMADLQRDSYNVTADRVAAALVRDLAKVAEALGSRYRETDAVGFDKLAGLVRHLVKKGCRVVLAIDEIEWLLPTNDEDTARARDFLSTMGSLRGLKHEVGEDLGIIVCGINEHFSEIGTILGYPNPVLDFFKCRYVAGLERSDFDSMLKTLGHRMGFDLAPNFLFQSFKQFGGHPYFARQFCSMVAHTETSRPIRINDDAFGKHYEAFLSEKGALLDQVMNYFKNFYPAEFAALEGLANDSVQVLPDAQVRHLVAYGLVSSTGKSLEIRVDAVKQWLHRKRRERFARAGSLLPERFELIAELGGGATARVYKVTDKILDEERAIKKYLPSVDAVAIRSELSILREIRSQYVVGAYDIVTDDAGGLCLVMDFVPGKDLESILQSRGRLPVADVQALADELFAAIESIHPNFARIDQLKQLPELDEGTMREYLRLRDGGYLHRDLKPSNIMVEDEKTWRCRLVDLGLTRAASAVGMTRVGTEAYAPPDWGGARWDASFDLYAVGVILHRAAYGIYPARSSDGLLTPQASADRHLWSFFARALGSSSQERFSQVHEMRAAFRAAFRTAS